jgi:hypothetical protein
MTKYIPEGPEDLKKIEEKMNKRKQLVIDNSTIFGELNWWVAWDPVFGAYWIFDGERPSGWAFDTPKPQNKMWQPEFQKVFGIHDGRDSPYLLYEVDAEYYDGALGKNRKWMNHVIKGGSCICSQEPPAATPDDTDQLTPLASVDEDDFERVMSKTCGNCNSRIPYELDPRKTWAD